MEYRAIVAPMPHTGMDSYAVKHNGEFTIVVDETLSREARIKAYLHEVDHIENGDFEEGDVGIIEIRTHRKY